MKTKKTSLLSIVTLLSITLCLMVSCSRHDDSMPRSTWVLTQSQRDSIQFSEYHHYNVGYNFMCSEGGLVLKPTPKGISMSLDYAPREYTLYKGDDFVITEIYRTTDTDSLQPDSIWLRVGSNDIPLGWVSEPDMLAKASPVDPISRFIYFCQHNRNLLSQLSLLLTIILIMYINHNREKRQDIDPLTVKSPYSLAQFGAVIVTGIIYSCMQHFSPSIWQEFYFHPSLNPVGQPLILALYLTFVWLCIILLLASAFDLNERRSFGKMLCTIAIQIVFAVFLYCAFASISTLLHVIAYSLLIVFIVALIIFRKIRKNRISAALTHENKEN